MKKLFFTFAWLFLATGAILTSVATYILGDDLGVQDLINFIKQKKSPATIVDTNSLGDQSQIQGASTVLETDDSRGVIVANFLERYKSPMQPYDYYGAEIVKIADKYGIDFRLLPAIAMQESGLCKNTNPDAPGNCLGFGIHKAGTLDFDNYLAGFDRAARELKERYIDLGLDTPEKIMTKYTPSSNGSWAESVKQWMAEMRYDDRAKGKVLKVDENVLELAR